MLSNVQIGENFIKLITTMIIIIYKDKEKTTIYSVFDRHEGAKMGALEESYHS